MPTQFFRTLLYFAKQLQNLQRFLGQSLRWLVFMMTLTMCVVVFGRSVGLTSVAIQESVSYMHAIVFMLCMAYTAQLDGHVRVDIFYRSMSEHQKAWINLFGSMVFLLPFAVFMAVISWHTAWRSWEIQESSINPGGLPFVFVLKSLTPLCGILLALHAVADICQQLVQVSVRNNRDIA